MKYLERRRIRFVLPAALFVLLLGGLISALLGDGLYDRISWLALTIPLGLVLFFLGRAVTPKRMSGHDDEAASSRSV